MEQRRTHLGWALLIAVLALLFCGVGMAEGNKRKLNLTFWNVPDHVTLYNVQNGLYPGFYPDGKLYFDICFDDYSTPITDTITLTLEKKVSDTSVINITNMEVRSYDDTILRWAYVSYKPVANGE